ncbi:MAG: hypothetical protein ACR2NW_01705 [Thermodesulfobacteriota bacterium]
MFNHISTTLYILLIVLCISCAPKSTDLSKALVTADSIYDDLYPQVEAALESERLTKKRKQSLLKIQSKLNDYTSSYKELQKSLAVWDETNTPPENTRKHYEKMKESLSEAVTIAYTVNIYITECSGRTTLRGKSGNCH